MNIVYPKGKTNTQQTQNTSEEPKPKQETKQTKATNTNAQPSQGTNPIQTSFWDELDRLEKKDSANNKRCYRFFLATR